MFIDFLFYFVYICQTLPHFLLATNSFQGFSFEDRTILYYGLINNVNVTFLSFSVSLPKLHSAPFKKPRTK